MACRSIQRCNAAEKDVLELTGASTEKVNSATLDLSSMESVRAFASEFKASEKTLYQWFELREQQYKYAYATFIP